MHASRVRQVQRLADFIDAEVPAGELLIVAGDFNDWGEKLDAPMRELRPAARRVAGRRAARAEHLPVARAGVLAGPHLHARAALPCRPRCRAARPGRACRTTCRWSPSSSSLTTHDARAPRMPARCAPATELHAAAGRRGAVPAHGRGDRRGARRGLLETYIFDFDRLGADGGRGAGARRAARRGRAAWWSTASAPRDVPADVAPRFAAAGVQLAHLPPGARLAAAAAAAAGGACTASCAWSTATVAFCGGINMLDDRYDPNHGSLDAAAAGLRGARDRPAGAPTCTTPWRGCGGACRRRATCARCDLAEGALERRVRAAAQRRRARRAGRTATPRGRTARAAALVLRDNLRHRRRIERTYREAIAQARERDHHRQRLLLPGAQAAARAAARGAARRADHAAAAGPLRVLHAVPRRPARCTACCWTPASRSSSTQPSFLHAKVAVIDARTGPPSARPTSTR